MATKRSYFLYTDQKGFSLIELIAVIIILGIVSVLVFGRFTNADTAAVQSGRDQVLNALFVAQQLAMVRDAGSDTIQVAITGDSADITENGNSLNRSGVQYPLALPEGVAVTGGTGVYTYDKLGRTTPAVIALSRGGTSASIRLEASGYAHSQ